MNTDQDHPNETCRIRYLDIFLVMRLKSKSRKFLRSTWLALHFYIGVVIGFVFVILGLTGSCNVFLYELEELGLPEVCVDTKVAVEYLDEIMHSVKSANPEKKDKWSILLPNDDTNYIWVEYPKPVEKAHEFYAPFRVQIDPCTGKIVAQSYWGETLWTQIYEIHADFLMGKLGEKIGRFGFNAVSFSGLFLLMSIITGLYLWWARWVQI